MDNFGNTMSNSYDGHSAEELVNDFIQIINELPYKVVDLRQVGRRVFAALDQYAGLPPVVKRVTDLVKKVVTLFKDIKEDIMRFYNVSNVQSIL